MNRRTLLKSLLASPLLGLFKKKEGQRRSGTRKCTPEEVKEFYSYMEEIHETTGTSSEGPCLACDEDGNEYLISYVYGRDYKLSVRKITDLSIDFWKEEVV